MNWLEIIDLRSAGNGIEALKQTLLRPVTKNDHKGGLTKISLYHHASVETDLSIHLKWTAEAKNPARSGFGLRLASSLKEFGRVNHSIWIEDQITLFNQKGGSEDECK